MSNILARNLFKQTLRTVATSNRRCFSVSIRRLQHDQEPNLKHKKIEDIIADFEKPLIDPQQEQEESGDPRTALVRSVEKFRPKRKTILSDNEMTQLRGYLNTAYTVSQLGIILQAHKLSKQKLKKDQLITNVIEKIWGLKTIEQVKQEAIKKQLDMVKQSFPTSRQELFFIIGDNGNTLRKIEQDNEVRIIIDVSSNQYIVEGPSAAVAKAKQEIKSHVNIQYDEMDIVHDLDQNTRDEVSNALVDVSKVAGTFITMKDNKFSLASVSDDSMENAKRLLSLMLADLKKKETNNTAIISNNNAAAEFTVLPFHDSTALSLYNRKLNWNRLISDKKGDSSEDTLKLLGNGKEIGNIENIKDILLQPFEQDTDFSNISMEARFGNILFQDPRNQPTSKISTTSELLDFYKNRTIFFNTMSPRRLASSFVPLISDAEGFHERTVRLDYLNKSLLLAKNKDMDLKKLSVEFNINEQGGISLKNITAIKNQSVIDILGAYGNVDIRLLANQFIDYSTKQEIKDIMLDQCKLTSYTELHAPKTLQSENMILEDITFSNKKKYILDKSSLVSINHIEQQDKRARRTEMIVNSVDPDTWSISNSIDRWPSFSNTLKKIASQWDYSSTSL